MKKNYKVFQYRWKNFLPLCLFFIYFSAYTQEKAIQSTLDILRKHMKEDSVRVNALVHLSYLYQTSNLKNSEYLGLNNDKLAEDFLRKAGILFKRINNFDQLGDAEINLAKVFVARANYDSAQHHFNYALSLFAKLDEPYQIADVYQHIAEMY